MSSEVKVQQKYVRKRVYIRRSTAKTLQAKVTAYRRDIPVISLGAAQTLTKGKGVAALTRGDKGRFSQRSFSGNTSIKVGNKRYSDAFINKTRYGSWQVMRRKTKKRYPVEVLKIPISKSVDRHARRIVNEQMRKEYPRIAEHEISFRIKRYAKR